MWISRIQLMIGNTFFAGSDPTSQLIRFAKQFRGTALHLDMISLGRGQGPRTEEAITKAYQQKGKWVFLQNCHHAESFMPRLQMLVRRWGENELMQSFTYSFRLNGSSVDHFTIEWLISCVFFLLCYQSLLLLLFNHFNLNWLRLKSLIPREHEPRSSLRSLW